MRRPNVYKARIGLMDVSFKELAFMMRERGLEKIWTTEISAAIHGGRQAKHETIRNEIMRIYAEWKSDVVKIYAIDFKNIL